MRTFQSRWPRRIDLLAVGPAAFMTVRGLTDSARNARVEWNEVGTALATTLGYAVAAALVATLVALPVSWCVVRRPSVASTVSERAVWVAHAVPSAILAFALVYLAVRLVPSLYKTSVVLIAGYVIVAVGSLDEAGRWAERYLETVGADEVDLRELEDREAGRPLPSDGSIERGVPSLPRPPVRE